MAWEVEQTHLMPRKLWSTLRDSIMTDPSRRAEIDEMGRASRIAVALGMLLDAQCATPHNEAARSAEEQTETPRIPEDASLFLATLKEGIKELGGRLEIAAVFTDRIELMEQHGYPLRQPVP